jgi:hypothetical protein
MRRFLCLLAPLVAVLAAVPAQARPRDDVLSGAFRCSVIADSRQWLDCYYGAAQPARAALGMPAALPAQVKLAVSPPAGGVMQDEAVRDDVMTGAAGCIRVAGDRPWLDCYYAAAQPMRVRLGLAAPTSKPAPAPVLAYAPPPVPAKPAGPPPMPRRTGGLFNGILNDPKPIVRNMPVQFITFDKDGAFTMTLSDGEVWAQSTEDAVYHHAHWRDATSDLLITISPDAMHTFTLVVSGEERIYKVKRIR